MKAETRDWQPGDKVLCNGNPNGRVLHHYHEGLYVVRLWDIGRRHIGDVCVSGRELKPAPTC